jgi:RND family efflux transporter MFP subunit
METLTHATPLVVDELLGELGPAVPLYDAPARHRSWLKWLTALILLAGLAGLAWAGWVAYRASLQPASTAALTTYTAKRGDLLVTVTEEGSLESAENVEIKCEVAGGTSIVWIIEDGKEVQKGTELLRLDGSKLKEDVSQQRIEYEKAVAAKIQAAKDYDAAKIAVEEYAQGTFKKDFSEAESKATVARGALRSAENSLQHGERMFRKGYISPLQLEALKTALEHAKLDLSTAEIARDVLQKFTRPKMMQELESKRDAAAAKRDSEKASLDLQEAKLKRLTTQWEKCTVRAPKAGLVIYANEQMYWGNRDSEIKAGMKVYEEQTILRLPDLSKMRAKVAVHEAKIDQLHTGMRTRIRVLDHEFQGAVVAVANRPETSWFMASSKKYPVKVNIDGKSKDLRPGMTAEVEILVDHLQNVISLPVAALAEKAGQAYCCVKKGTALERRNVTLGEGNDKFVEIKQGLSAGEEVVLNPRAALGETSEEPRKPDVDVKRKFGAPTKSAATKRTESSKKKAAHDAPAASVQDAKPQAEKAGKAEKDAKPAGAKGNK